MRKLLRVLVQKDGSETQMMNYKDTFNSWFAGNVKINDLLSSGCPAHLCVLTSMSVFGDPPKLLNGVS